MLNTKFCVLLILVAVARISLAYPRYAVEHRITQCTACHVSTAGGGLLNLDGKAFGSHGYQPSVFAQQEYVGAEWRYLYFKSQDSNITRDGSGLMAAIFGVNIPVIHKGPESFSDIRLVFNHSFSGFASDRDTYLQFKFNNDDEHKALQYLEVGRLQVPFGVRTDEHRTYTRMITQTTYNDFVSGIGVSGLPVEPLHYDVMLVNGDVGYTPGQLAVEKSNKWGGVANVRWTSPYRNLPVILGASGMSIDRLTTPHATAESFYGLASLGRWTQGRVPVTVTVEYVQSKNLNVSNPDLGAFVTDPNYFTSIADSKSEGVLFQADWDVYEQLVLTLKAEEMILDMDFPGDVYRRYGLGATYYFGPGLSVMARYELASVGRSSENVNPKLGAQNAFWSVLEAAF
jgi:hypothetical protein